MKHRHDQALARLAWLPVDPADRLVREELLHRETAERDDHLRIDQLDLLSATMDKIFDAVVRVDADALIVHGRFLQEKFGHASTGGALNLGEQPAPEAPRSTLDLP